MHLQRTSLAPVMAQTATQCARVVHARVGARLDLDSHRRPVGIEFTVKELTRNAMDPGPVHV